MSNEISAEYIRAHELDVRIKTSAQLAQKSLYDMCISFKEMRDSRLYKELGYKNFEEYCETEVGIRRNQAYKYISVVENLDSDFVSSRIQNAGVQKLYLLSTLNDEHRTEITENTNLETVTVKELQAKIKELEIAKNTSDMKLDELNRENIRIEKQRSKLQEHIEELESRPIEVVASPVNDEAEKMRQAMLQNSREWGEKYDKLQAENEASERSLHQKYQTALSEQKADYEKKLAEAKANEQSGESDEITVFKAYFTMAYQAFQNLVQFAQQAKDKTLMQEKIRKLTDTVMQSMEG